MDKIRDICPIDEKRYQKAVDIVRTTLGSYEGIAAKCYTLTGVTITGNCVRRWFMLKTIPVEYAAVFCELTDGAVGITDFFPWLSDYL